MPSSPVTPATRIDAGADRSIRTFLALVTLVFVVGSRLLWSSPEYRQQHLLLASLLALLAFRAVCWPVLRRSGWPGVAFGAGLLVAHAASWVGGVRHGAAPLAATAAALQGLLGVAGLAVLVTVLLEARWHRHAKWTAFTVLTLLAVGSFGGYFISIERYIPLGGYAHHYEPLRLALIWPTRLLTVWFGQIAWDHTNYAAYYFALSFALILESLAAGVGGRRWLRWGWCGLLCAGVYLTASRSGGLMVALALPLILIGRPPRFAAATLVTIAVAIGCGYGGLMAKIAMLPTEPAKPPPTTALHGSNYVKRASSGRTAVYRQIWQDLEGSRCCGMGLAATGQPVLYLNQEHSSYMATLRGGGLLALAGHALMLAAAAWSAWLLLRRGLRWPAVLLVVALGGLLFDRSTVIGITGNYEFLSHWVAVLIPLLLASPIRGGTQTRSGASASPGEAD